MYALTLPIIVKKDFLVADFCFMRHEEWFV